jgi:hypothetical protein
VTGEFIQKCAYAEKRSPYCSVFKIEQILNEAEPDKDEQELMLLQGGIVKIEINWNCDYDSFWLECLPVYNFKRFDFASSKSKVLSGFNFR